jgi:hypothetical protein
MTITIVQIISGYRSATELTALGKSYATIKE